MMREEFAKDLVTSDQGNCPTGGDVKREKDVEFGVQQPGETEKC